MLAVLLLFLKIIGLVLLGILGLFLAVMLLVLFTPVSYRVWVSGDSSDPGELAYRVKIQGIQLLPKKERKKRSGRKRAKKPEEAMEKPDMDHEKTEASPTQQESPEAPNAVESKVTEPKVMESQTPKLPGGEAAEPQKAVEHEVPEKILPDGKDLNKREKRLNKKERHPREKNPEKNAKKTTRKKEKSTSTADVRALLGQIRTEITDEGNQRALGHVLSELRYLLRHFGPRRMRADLAFSLGEPAGTGYAVAALALCPFSYGKDCRLLPDFEAEQFYVRGWMEVSGHVRTVHVLLILLRLLFDRDIRKILKKVRNRSKKTGGEPRRN